ncbi:MAG TPA: 50S ribosomal protein L11 methyltransferase [Rhizobiaceae bacterium]|nr:50S ribosomal protein L11 methyltransferase [Rhizobiaceae bacterium]
MAAGEIERFITEKLVLTPVPGLPEISLYTAHPASGVGRLSSRSGSSPPYWAFRWAGGMALAHHFTEMPSTVAGLTVLDLGAGSGLVGIAAAKAGATKVIAVDIDPNAAAAITLNATANGVFLRFHKGDLATSEPPEVDLVAVGDLFYEAELAKGVLRFLDRCFAKGIRVLVGDPGRTHLPRSRLLPIAEYRVADVGFAPASPPIPAWVFALQALAPGQEIPSR